MLAQIDQIQIQDFIIEGDHARISQRKVAEIIGVTQKTVSKWTDTLTDTTLAETIKEKGFNGDTLNQIVGYYATSSAVKREVKENCVKLLIESSKLGFQMLIDKMAGLESSIETDQMKLFNDYCQVTDLIFKNTHIKTELIAGVKLSQAQKMLPSLANNLKDNQKLLIQSTASDVKLVTPTELGKSLNLSAQKVNQLLIEQGLQVKNDAKKSRKEPSYLPTDKGHEFCSFTLATGKSGDTTSYQQLLWYESVMNIIG